MSLSAQQLQIRSQGLGASEAASALGVSRYCSPWKLWARRLGLIPGSFEGWDIDRGNALEPAILAWYARVMGCELQQPGTLIHPTRPCILATPDSIAVKGGHRWLVECKAPSGRTRKFWGDAGTDQIDPEYLPQAVAQMAVTGLDRVDVVASIAGEEPSIYTVLRRERLEVKVVDRLCAWWDRHIIGREAPAVDGSDEARAWLSESYQRPTELWLESTPEVDAMAQERRSLAAQIAKAEDQKSQIENSFRAIIADAEGIEGEGWRASWKANKHGARTLRFTFEE